VSVVSTDSLGAVLENVLSPEAAPDLFVFSKFNEMPMPVRVKLMRMNPAEHIDHVRKESYIVWKAVEAFIRKENKEGRDLLVEGVAVLPELMSQLEDIPHRLYLSEIKEKITKRTLRNLLKRMRRIGCGRNRPIHWRLCNVCEVDECLHRARG